MIAVLIASNFGALGECFLGGSALLCAFILGLIAVILRLRWLSLLSTLLCMVTAALLFIRDQNWLTAYEHYPKSSVYAQEALQAHSDLRFFEICAICLGLFVSAGAFLPPRQRRAKNPHDHSRSRYSIRPSCARRFAR